MRSATVTGDTRTNSRRYLDSTDTALRVRPAMRWKRFVGQESVSIGYGYETNWFDLIGIRYEL